MAYSAVNPFRQLISYDAGWISRQLGGSGQPNGAGWHHCRCPVHLGDSTSVLSLKNAPSGRLVVKCFHGCDPADIHQALDRLVAGAPISFSPSRGSQASVAADNTQQAGRIWSSSRSDPLLSAYLRSRSIAIEPPADLRFHPNLLHQPSGSRWPAMVALVRDAGGNPAGIHRTWLATTGRGKAPIDRNKMSLGPVSGGAVRLSPVTDTVLLGEGLETTLSAMQLTNLPGWSTLSSSGLKAVQLPLEIRSVAIAADHDAPGLEAAEALRERLEIEGRSVSVLRPNREGADFNNILREQAR